MIATLTLQPLYPQQRDTGSSSKPRKKPREDIFGGNALQLHTCHLF